VLIIVKSFFKKNGGGGGNRTRVQNKSNCSRSQVYSVLVQRNWKKLTILIWSHRCRR